MFKELVKELSRLRERTARFRAVALHLHSPDSRDWGRGAKDATRNDRRRFDGPDGLVAFADELRSDLHLVAITDHMRAGFSTKLSIDIGANDEFIVLPGMEVNFRPEGALGYARIHLLVIMPEGSTIEHFARLFYDQPSIPADASRSGQEEVQGISLKEWVARVHEQGGICIAAHVDGPQGVRFRFRQTARDTLRLFSDTNSVSLERDHDVGGQLKRYLLESGIDAVEIHRASDALHYRWTSEEDGRARLLATVLTFDAHCVEDFARHDRYTHVKMTRLGLAGLHDALTFADTRIRFPDNLPSAPSPRLLGIEIRGEESSFFGKTKVQEFGKEAVLHLIDDLKAGLLR